MSSDHIQRKMDFIVEQQAKFTVDMELVKESIRELREAQKEQGENINRLFETVTATQVQADTDRIELREAIDNLIIANEGTRKLAEEVARLAIQTKRRVDLLEGKQ